MGVYGMTYDEFWRDDPWLAKHYREAFVERRKEENRRDWLLGAYVYNAVSTAIANAFRKKGAKRLDYIEEPFPIFQPTKEEKAAKKAKEIARMEAAMERFAKEQKAKRAKREKNAETRNP